MFEKNAKQVWKMSETCPENDNPPTMRCDFIICYRDAIRCYVCVFFSEKYIGNAMQLFFIIRYLISPPIAVAHGPDTAYTEGWCHPSPRHRAFAPKKNTPRGTSLSHAPVEPNGERQRGLVARRRVTARAPARPSWQATCCTSCMETSFLGWGG